MFTDVCQSSFILNICLSPAFLAVGDHSGGLGGDHVLRDGRSFLLQLHLLYPADHSKSQMTTHTIDINIMVFIH